MFLTKPCLFNEHNDSVWHKKNRKKNSEKDKKCRRRQKNLQNGLFATPALDIYQAYREVWINISLLKDLILKQTLQLVCNIGRR